MIDVVGLGAINIDLIFQLDDLGIIKTDFNHFGIEKLIPGSEQIIDIKNAALLIERLNQLAVLKKKSPGGQAANVISAISNMGYSAALTGIVGLDADGDFFLKNMDQVNTNFIVRRGTTGYCISILSETDNNDRLSFVVANSNDALEINDINIDMLEDSRILHISSFANDKQLKIQERIAKKISGKVIISLDVGELYSMKGLRKIQTLLRYINIMFLTEKELKFLTGFDDISQGCKYLLSFGPEIVVCKLGSRGSQVFSVNEDYLTSSKRIHPVDTTGAGDVYCAGFLAGYLNNLTLEACSKFANQVAAQSLAGYGHDAYPNKLFHDQKIKEYNVASA